MENFIGLLQQPWPWYVAGPLIGLTIPLLLLIGNKSLGISSSLRHVCAACFPSNIPFFKYEWKKEIWNLLFIGGVFLGGVIAATALNSGEPIQVNENLKTQLADYEISDYNSLIPTEVFNWSNLLTLEGFILMVIGGFLVGFGTRYAGGCTSGHSIMGISNLQWPSVIATVFFMIGGLIMANLILPFILNL